jgi:hypothetical protein
MTCRNAVKAGNHRQGSVFFEAGDERGDGGRRSHEKGRASPSQFQVEHARVHRRLGRLSFPGGIACVASMPQPARFVRIGRFDPPSPALGVWLSHALYARHLRYVRHRVLKCSYILFSASEITLCISGFSSALNMNSKGKSSILLQGEAESPLLESVMEGRRARRIASLVWLRLAPMDHVIFADRMMKAARSISIY